MIRERVPFLNREDELAEIAKHLQVWGTRRLVCIQGPPGIGKTRLMQEVGRRFAALDFGFPLKVCDIIDFDDFHFHMPQNVGREIARQLGQDALRPYLEALRDGRLAEDRGAPREYMTRSILEVNRTFIDCFNRVSDRKRILLRLDTTDALQESQPFEYMLQIALQLQNVLFLFAGRDANVLYDALRREVGGDAILVRLGPFEMRVGREYLLGKQRGLPFDLDPEWADKLLILSGGHPILIDMAFDWAVHNVPIPWMEEITLPKLQRLADSTTEDDQGELAQLRKRFRRELVSPIRRIESDVDQLALMLSKMLVLAKAYPLDVKGIAALLAIDRDDAKALFDRAQTWTIIKVLPDGRIKLHDAVQEMINKHVWPEIDPEGNRQRRDSKRAIAYLTDRTNGLMEEIRTLRQGEQRAQDAAELAEVLRLFGDRMTKERELWVLRAERLRRMLEFDVQQGYQWFLEDFREQRRLSGGRQYREILIAQIQPYVDQLSRERRLEFERIRARHLTDDGDYRLAAEVYKELLADLPENSLDRVEALVGRGNLLLRTGDIPTALDDFKEALKLSQELGDVGWAAKSLLALGYAHRLSGELDKAVQRYRDAYLQAIEVGDRERQALALNNIAFVYAIQKQEQEAFGTIQQAIALWKELLVEAEEYRFRLGQSYNTAGEIHIELGQPEESLPYFELAWNIFDRVEGVEEEQEPEQAAEWKSRARSGRGFAHWLMGDLENARRDLEWAERYATASDTPTTLHRLSHIYWDLGEEEKAEAGWRESMERARQVGDMFTEFNSLTDLARIAFEQPVAGFDHWQDFEAWYENYRLRYPYPRFLILEGLLYTYLGNLALKAGQTKQAISLYQRGFPLLAQTGTFAYFNLGGQLAFIEEEILPVISVESVRRVGETLLATWSPETPYLAAMNYFRRWKQWPQESTRSSGG
jgi:tetratricopeptide (TPR) repeat protein